MMNFNPNERYILEDERVLLRPLLPEDIEHLKHFVLTEPEIWKYSLTAITGLDDLEKYIENTVTARSAGKEYPFIVYDKLKQQYAGSTRFYDIQRDNNTLQLGYTWYGKDFQRTGLNRHCKYLLLSFAFEQLGVDRVEFRADADNSRSVAAMKAMGCTVEGILRSHLPRPDFSRRNTIVLSILKPEWFSFVKPQLLGLL